MATSYINSFSFLLAANDILMIGYFYYSPKSRFNTNSKWILQNSNAFIILTTIIFFMFLYGSYGRVLMSIQGGRQLGNVLGSSINLWGTFIGAGSLMVSGMAAYFYRWYSKSNFWFSLFFLVPIFTFQMLLGTRFRLVYMLLPYLILSGIINVRKQSIKNLIVIMAGALFLSALSNFVRDNRSLSLSEMINQLNYYSSKKQYNDVYIGIADKMSPEGCVYMTRLAEDYYSTHSHEYGKEIGFMFYWVIPRAIWKDKPTPIDHWLIREYENVPDQHSTASGFTGEIRADFGYWCLIIVFFWGWLLRYADAYVYNAFKDDSPYLEKLFASLIYPCVFFFVRSPLTATQSFFVEVLIYLAIRKWMGTKSSSQEVRLLPK
ncbi:MAG: oligosaccharide repeat unit polymerase [Prevotella sp.]|nr:oligosaccharide repeat unit polymerase [Prevotella sp.]